VLLQSHFILLCVHKLHSTLLMRNNTSIARKKPSHQYHTQHRIHVHLTALMHKIDESCRQRLARLDVAGVFGFDCTCAITHDCTAHVTRTEG
jgi:hypothetical protein